MKIVPNKEHQEGSRVCKDIFLQANKSHNHFSLSVISTPPLGDCLPQSCLLSLCNRNDRLTEEEEEKLSITKWAMCNKFANSNAQVHEHEKYSSLRSCKVGYNLSPSLHMNADDASILAHMLKRSIVVVQPCSRKNGASNVDLTTHVPLGGNKSRSKQHMLILEKDFSMCCITDSRTMNGVHINIPELIKKMNQLLHNFMECIMRDYY